MIIVIGSRRSSASHRQLIARVEGYLDDPLADGALVKKGDLSHHPAGAAVLAGIAAATH